MEVYLTLLEGCLGAVEGSRAGTLGFCWAATCPFGRMVNSLPTKSAVCTQYNLIHTDHM